MAILNQSEYTENNAIIQRDDQSATVGKGVSTTLYKQIAILKTPTAEKTQLPSVDAESAR
jgi:hypothetical protein